MLSKVLVAMFLFGEYSLRRYKAESTTLFSVPDFDFDHREKLF